MAKYCADCYNMDTNANKEGLFKCLNSKKSGYDTVSARKIACSCFGEAFHSKRSERDREGYIRISKNHGYYIITAITKVLNLENNNDIMKSFKYIRDIVMPRDSRYQSFIDDYEELAPLCAELLKDEENKDYCGYLYSCYLEPFSVLVSEEEIYSAIELYISMFNEIKKSLKIEISHNLELSY